MWRQAEKYEVPRIAFINKMDRTGADFYNAIETMKDRLSANAVPIQYPVGAEENFRGVVDLVGRRFIHWEGDDINTEMVVDNEVPADLVDEVEVRRAVMVEAVCRNRRRVDGTVFG